MPCTTFLHTNESTNVTDKDLRELLNESLYISQNYIVKERSWIEKKWFKKDIKHTHYAVYFKLPAPNGGWIGDVQCIGFSGGPLYDQVYSYFLGIITGLDVTEKEYRKGSIETRMHSENQGITFKNVIPPLTIDELIERLKEMRKYEGGKCPVFVGISDFEDRPITHVAIDHFAIVLNG